MGCVGLAREPSIGLVTGSHQTQAVGYSILLGHVSHWGQRSKQNGRARLRIILRANTSLLCLEQLPLPPTAGRPDPPSLGPPFFRTFIIMGPCTRLAHLQPASCPLSPDSPCPLALSSGSPCPNQPEFISILPDPPTLHTGMTRIYFKIENVALPWYRFVVLTRTGRTRDSNLKIP